MFKIYSFVLLVLPVHTFGVLLPEGISAFTKLAAQHIPKILLKTHNSCQAEYAFYCEHRNFTARLQPHAL